jgi:hypothetical protein
MREEEIVVTMMALVFRNGLEVDRAILHERITTCQDFRKIHVVSLAEGTTI